jgi:hypothetical protein
MQFIFSALILALGISATPLIAPADAAVQKEVKCEIVHIDDDANGVDCWWYPSHAPRFNGSSNYVVKTFKEKTSKRFNCYVNGEKIKGIK